MNTFKLTSDEIIRSLMALGFRVVGEKDKQTIVQKGYERIYITQGLIPSEQESFLKDQLKPYFSRPMNIPSNHDVDRVRNWIAAPAK
jgi:hypothetical protein